MIFLPYCPTARLLRHSAALRLAATHNAYMTLDPADVPLVMTLRAIVDGEQPVTMVIHEDDDVGGWQYLTRSEWSNDDLLLVHRDHLTAADGSLLHIGDLAVGRYATRQAPTSPWSYGEVDEIETQ